MNKIALGILSIIVLGSSPLAFADSDFDAKLEFAGTLEETLGHFWALEMNLDESNTELAIVHATHPISELYDTMSTHLDANPEFNEELEMTLLELKDNASTSVTRNDAQAAVEDAKAIIQEAREIVIGEELSEDSAFKAQLINGLLETSKVEYMEAIEDGNIVEMAEFQDGSAFIWRSQQIFEEIRSDVANSGKVNDTYVQIWEAYEQRHSPEQVTLLVDELIAEFEIVSGIESEESSHMEEVFGTDDVPLQLEETIHMDSEISDEKDVASLPPLKQIKEGVEPENIQCKESFELIFKPSGGPACVNTTSVQKLVSWGWTQ
ncbi:hypothetical protein C5F47_04805 [Nitrosopumilus cobalaminigenes]|uniref:PEFG-CTERM domain-containing protein n=1 Tax=Nitrosopumilus cobalaminigenes TaxID=1470066 RepID=A0A7D5M0Q3_9ARCH|nr:hypothetical protein [Nitrosopumilus cobalaminigenes]QLH02915.1 hypothetical protein C5F47_04805 [Nitrosopumilus cobalaminigenes]